MKFYKYGGWFINIDSRKIQILVEADADLNNLGKTDQ